MKKAVRTMKARKWGKLACGCWVNVGTLIINRGDGWRCTEHSQLPGQKTLWLCSLHDHD